MIRQFAILVTLVAILVCSFEGSCTDHDLAEMLEHSSSAAVEHDHDCDHCPFCTGGVTPMGDVMQLTTVAAVFTEIEFVSRPAPAGVALPAFHPPRA